MRLTRWLVSKLPVSDHGKNAEDTLFRRYTLLKCRFGAVYLHEFLRSDADRCLHDHPWGFVSVVLKGGYHEQMADGVYWRRPGSILRRPAATAHRIILNPWRGPVWSLVFRGRKVRDWGFHTMAGWKKWTPDFAPICETD